MEPAVTAAIVAGVTVFILSGLSSVARYTFGIEIPTHREVDNKIEVADEELEEGFDEICDKLDENTEQLNKLEDLILGSEYQVDDGMLELVEGHEERIEGVERIQLRIRRRQGERIDDKEEDDQE